MGSLEAFWDKVSEVEVSGLNIYCNIAHNGSIALEKTLHYFRSQADFSCIRVLLRKLSSCVLRASTLAVDRSQTFIKSKVIAATEELLLWRNRLLLSCRAEISCPPPVRPPGSSDRSLGVLSLCKSTFLVLQLLKYRAATSAPELTAGSTRSRQCRRHLGAVSLEASSTLEICLGPGGEKSFESVFWDPVLIPTWYRDSKLSLPMISVLRWEIYFS